MGIKLTHGIKQLHGNKINSWNQPTALRSSLRFPNCEANEKPYDHMGGSVVDSICNPHPKLNGTVDMGCWVKGEAALDTRGDDSTERG